MAYIITMAGGSWTCPGIDAIPFHLNAGLLKVVAYIIRGWLFMMMRFDRFFFADRWAGMALIFVLALSASALGRTAPWGAIVVGTQTSAEHLATVDLQRYLGQVTGRVPVILTADAWQKRPVPAVIIGAPASNSLLVGLALDAAELSDEGYLLEQQAIGKTPVVVAAGRTPAGSVNAIYGLLRELGFGFYLGSEAIPATIPDSLPAARIARRPGFKIRGVLPWHNFFNSPTAWDAIDHRAFVDQLARSGANFIGFHTYDSEPFAAAEEQGKMQWGHRLLNTATSTWSTHPMATADFAFGTRRLFADPYFGAATTFLASDDEAIRAEQRILRDALEYARQRGLHTCIGFEMVGNPTTPADREAFLKRLNHLLDQYPMIDYLWLWQTECVGATGYTPTDPHDPLTSYGLARRETFRRIVERTTGVAPFFQNTPAGKQARAVEGARIEQFARLAGHALAHRPGAPRLVLSGWGGDERILSAEYYEGLDKLLPKDVVFASLDSLKGWQDGAIPWRTRIDNIYHELPADRERWPIMWMEGDGDQWHPQPGIYQYFEEAMRDTQRSGSQGWLAIHWRTRDIQENFAYPSQFTWDPSLTGDRFFADFARRCYGPVAEPMTPILIALDKLGYRWVSGGGQSECGPFGWEPGVQENVDKLKALRGQIVELRAQAGPAKAQVDWLLARIDWILNFRETEVAAKAAVKILKDAAAAPPEQAHTQARQALALLDGEAFPAALRANALGLTTRGAYGVLATINTKAVFAWRELRSQALKLSGQQKPEPGGEWSPEPAILLPRLLGSVEAERELTLQPIVLGGRPAFVRYRTLGQRRWQNVPLLTGKDNWVAAVTIPASAVQTPGLELAFSFYKSARQPAALGPLTVTVMPPLAEGSARPPAQAPGGPFTLTATACPGTAAPLELTWNDLPEADYYKVYRDGKLLVETAVAWLPDHPAATRGEYTVEAWRDGHILARSDAIPYAGEVR